MATHSYNGAGRSFGLPLRWAWWGRVSTEDQQDPTLSLPRQLHNSRAALPSGAVIVAHFYDVESGRKDLALRGRGSAHERFQIPIPRDGGIQELLGEAVRAGCRFDAVICESIERIARRTYYGTKIEHDLERAGIALFAADEPILASGKRATTILTRRVKQGVAEWYVLEMLEKSWDGFCEHTKQGWNVGAAPYGYLLDKIPHPVPARRAEGRTKSRLAPDPERAPVIHQMFIWRAVERLGYPAITARLNADLERYPPPVSPDPARRKEYWSRSSVRDLLSNPKYTGYMVWNRRATKNGGRVNPPESWIWSQQPTHEPIVTREIFEAAAAVASQRQRSRNGAGPNHRHPETKRSYPLRSFVFCELCGRRMSGKVVHGDVYYACRPGLNLGAAEARRRYPDHPPIVHVREDALLEGTYQFFARQVLGPERRQLLEDKLACLDEEGERKRRERLERLRKAVEKVEARQTRLVRALEEDDDPEGIMFRRIRQRVADLEGERRSKHQELCRLEKEEDSSDQQIALLDELPIGEAKFPTKPDESLHRLFETFRLKLLYDAASNRVGCRVTIGEAALDAIIAEAARILRRPGKSDGAAGDDPGGACVHLVRAPGEIRTHTLRILSPLPLPLGYGGPICRTIVAPSDSPKKR